MLFDCRWNHQMKWPLEYYVLLKCNILLHLSNRHNIIKYLIHILNWKHCFHCVLHSFALHFALAQSHLWWKILCQGVSLSVSLVHLSRLMIRKMKDAIFLTMKLARQNHIASLKISVYMYSNDNYYLIMQFKNFNRSPPLNE